jgi:4a-hydroxytetrahydrobiopterin dehydratase
MITLKRSIIAIAFLAFSAISVPLTIAETTSNNSMLLSETEINTKLEALPRWTTDGTEISRTFEFDNFVAAVDFVNRLVEPAESAQHHPDLTIAYNKVTVSLSTHDAGGLTDRDFTLAEEISQLANTN